MRPHSYFIVSTVWVGLIVSVANAANAAPPQSAAILAPTVISVSGQLPSGGGPPLTGPHQVVISLYRERNDQEPLWVEFHTVIAGPQGEYSAVLGAGQANGLPGHLFGADGARWLGVAIQGEPEQPRMMLVSVPYASRAGVADTLAGRTPSDFVLAETLNDGARAVLEARRTTARSETVSEPPNGFISSAESRTNIAGAEGALAGSVITEGGGNVGIGVPNPDGAPLHIARPSSLNSDARRIILAVDSRPAAAGVGGGISFGGHYTSDGGYVFDFGNVKGVKENDFDSNFAGALAFSTRIHGGRPTERLRITSNGRVGIGTPNPDGAPLQIEMPVSVNNDARRSILAFDSSASAPGVGGGISFGGFYSGESYVFDFANVKGIKESSDDANYAGALAFSTRAHGGRPTERVRITSSGNVGIGTATPSSKLHVAGNLTVDGNIGARYQDVAEWVDAAEPLEPGTVVIIDDTASNRVLAASQAYDLRVAGAVSSQPGLILGERRDGRVLVAQSGRVRVKADATYGAIRPGDLLVSSPTKGHVMVSQPMEIGGVRVHRPGTLIGKALEALHNGRAEILVLLTLQ